MNKIKIRKGDLVRVISGTHKGKEGKVLKIDSGSQRALVEGVNIVKKTYQTKLSGSKRWN